jgi:hypothetical protein
VEYGWFCETFGREFEDLPHERTLVIEPHESTADIVALYGAARAASDRVVAETALTATGPAWFGEDVTLRWVLIHEIEETARHVGHMDIVRELIDGVTGDYQRD